MTVKEALELAKASKLTRDKEPLSDAFEYDSYFVFDFRKDPNAKVLDSLVGVNKKTKKVSVFMPIMVSREEFKNKKKIKI